MFVRWPPARGALRPSIPPQRSRQPPALPLRYVHARYVGRDLAEAVPVEYGDVGARRIVLVRADEDLHADRRVDGARRRVEVLVLRVLRLVVRIEAADHRVAANRLRLA